MCPKRKFQHEYSIVRNLLKESDKNPFLFSDEIGRHIRDFFPELLPAFRVLMDRNYKWPDRCETEYKRFFTKKTPDVRYYNPKKEVCV